MVGDERQSPWDQTPGPEPFDDKDIVQAAIKKTGEALDPETLEETVKKVMGEMGAIPKARETKIRPSEKRRRQRQLSVTFSDASIPNRLRALAKQWGVLGPDGRRPNFSKVIEYLLLPQLEAAEEGRIESPKA